MCTPYIHTHTKSYYEECVKVLRKLLNRISGMNEAEGMRCASCSPMQLCHSPHMFRAAYFFFQGLIITVNCAQIGRKTSNVMKTPFIERKKKWEREKERGGGEIR